jgi:hypothetical protein
MEIGEGGGAHRDSDAGLLGVDYCTERKGAEARRMAAVGTSGDHGFRTDGLGFLQRMNPGKTFILFLTRLLLPERRQSRGTARLWRFRPGGVEAGGERRR